MNYMGGLELQRAYYTGVVRCLKKNQNAPRPSEHPPVRGEKMSKRSGGIKGCKYKTSSWHCYYDKIYLQLIDMGGLRLQRAIGTD